MLKQIELLKIGLLTKGMQVSETARKAIEGDEKRPLTLADYASTSGISMQLENSIWVNAPIVDYNPNFVSETPYTLDFNGEFFVRSGAFEAKAVPVPVPAYHNQVNAHGEKYTHFAITHTDRVRISPIWGCANICFFCDVPYKSKYIKKNAESLIETIQVALNDSVLKARHVLISGGTPKPEDYGYENDVYEKVAAAFPGIDVDVMMIPIPGLLNAERLKKAGVHGLSINLELFNEEMARVIMFYKWQVNKKRYLDFIEGAVPVFGEGKVRSLLMAGVESLEDTLRGVEALAERGCDPVLSPFRPDPSTPMKDKKPPTAEFLAELYERARDIVEKHPNVKMGPRCIPCMHNTLTFPDGSGKYFCY